MKTVISTQEKGQIVRLERIPARGDFYWYNVSVNGRLLPEPPSLTLEEGLEKYHETCKAQFPGYGV